MAIVKNGVWRRFFEAGKHSSIFCRFSNEKLSSRTRDIVVCVLWHLILLQKRTKPGIEFLSKCVFYIKNDNFQFHLETFMVMFVHGNVNIFRNVNFQQSERKTPKWHKLWFPVFREDRKKRSWVRNHLNSNFLTRLYALISQLHKYVATSYLHGFLFEHCKARRKWIVVPYSRIKILMPRGLL